MFVDIENYKSPLAIENLLTPYKKGLVIDGVRQLKAQITTDVCFEVLRSLFVLYLKKGKALVDVASLFLLYRLLFTSFLVL